MNAIEMHVGFMSIQFFVGGLIPYVRYVCLFEYSGVQRDVFLFCLRLVYSHVASSSGLCMCDYPFVFSLFSFLFIFYFMSWCIHYQSFFFFFFKGVSGRVFKQLLTFDHKRGITSHHALILTSIVKFLRRIFMAGDQFVLTFLAFPPH